MIDDKVNNIEKYYDYNIERSDMDYQILGWESLEAQYKRFDIFNNYFDLNNKKILDVGCGLGSFYKYLKTKKISVDYTGVDILEKMIEQSAKNHPDGKFTCIDIFDENTTFDEKYDYVFSSGIFNLNLGNNREFLKKAVDKFFKLSTHGTAFNLLNPDSLDKESKYFYIHPGEAISLISDNFTKIFNFKVDKTYLNNDYTVILTP